MTYNRPVVFALTVLYLIAPLLTMTHTGWGNGIITSSTQFDKKIDAYVTTGEVLSPIPVSHLATIANNFSNYNNWALKGINGGEGNPHKFLLQIREMTYIQREPWGRFQVNYDIDLLWPLGRKGNLITFDIVDATYKEKMIKSLTIDLQEKSLFINTFRLHLEMDTQQKQSRIRFHSTVKLASLIQLFFNLNNYKRNIEWRIIKVIKNLQAEADQKTLDSLSKSAPNTDNL